MPNVEHKTLGAADMHSVVAWTWANATARLAQAVTAGDVHKLGYQTDTGAYWYLAGTGPTVWKTSEDATSLKGKPMDASVGTATRGNLLTFDGTNWTAANILTVDGAGSTYTSLGLSLQNTTASTTLQGQASPVLAFVGGWGAGQLMIAGIQLRHDGPVAFGSPDPTRELGFFYSADLITITKLFGMGTNGTAQVFTIYGATRCEFSMGSFGSIVGDSNGFRYNVGARHTWAMNNSDAVKLEDATGAPALTGIPEYSAGTAVDFLVRGGTPTGARAGLGVGIVGGGGGTGNQNGGGAYLKAGAKSGTGTDGTAELRDSAGTARVTVKANQDVEIKGATNTLIFSGATQIAQATATTFDITTNAWLNIAKSQALGGGAAATLGTIGGTGPTAAAQSKWVEIKVNGTTHWIPAWV